MHKERCLDKDQAPALEMLLEFSEYLISDDMERDVEQDRQVAMEKVAGFLDVTPIELVVIIRRRRLQQYSKALRRLRGKIRKGKPLEGMDSTTLGAKYTECTWGFCRRGTSKCEADGHKPICRCPFDPRSMTEGGECGCFRKCAAFDKGRRRVPKISKTEALKLYDARIEELSRYEKALDMYEKFLEDGTTSTCRGAEWSGDELREYREECGGEEVPCSVEDLHGTVPGQPRFVSCDE